jgi:hypothetical protein
MKGIRPSFNIEVISGIVYTTVCPAKATISRLGILEMTLLSIKSTSPRAGLLNVYLHISE